jgi:hypothetical protein
MTLLAMPKFHISIFFYQTVYTCLIAVVVETSNKNKLGWGKEGPDYDT